MKITDKTLPAIQADEKEFVEFFQAFAIELMADAAFYPVLNKQRILAAHGAWCQDLERINHHEKKLKEGLDHFKRAGHLAYWVRRLGPIIDATANYNLQDSFSHPPNAEQEEMRAKMFGFWNEYVAFEMGFQFCKFYEVGQAGATRNASFAPNMDYYDTMCQFLKYKNVSPHALFLIYKSLFVR
jgi:hypothetical protein